tara:strand:- start:2191 stop:2544 length:354 start_codon:yes stop_codon:yes gene_type:complete
LGKNHKIQKISKKPIMSKTYTHAEVMDLIHKSKESEREIWREKINEKNKRIEELGEENKPMTRWGDDVGHMIETIMEWKHELCGEAGNINFNFTYPDILDMIEKQKMFYLKWPDVEE